MRYPGVFLRRGLACFDAESFACVTLGAVSPKEAESHAQRRQLSIKVANGSGEEEWDWAVRWRLALPGDRLPAAAEILRFSVILSSPMSKRAICTF